MEPGTGGRTPVEIPSQFSSLHKCRFHFGFSLGTRNRIRRPSGSVGGQRRCKYRAWRGGSRRNIAGGAQFHVCLEEATAPGQFVTGPDITDQEVHWAAGQRPGDLQRSKPSVSTDVSLSHHGVSLHCQESRRRPGPAFRPAKQCRPKRPVAGAGPDPWSVRALQTVSAGKRPGPKINHRALIICRPPPAPSWRARRRLRRRFPHHLARGSTLRWRR